MPVGPFAAKHIYEITWLEKLVLSAPDIVRTRRLGEVTAARDRLPVYGLVVGPDDPSLPTFALVGGVHGLERVGTHVVLSFLEMLWARLGWDQDLRRTFRKVRLVTVPLLNPGGMMLGSRSNPAGVDLMRNAPISAEQRPKFLLGGHRLSSRLPWYRGRKGDPLEPEAAMLTEFIRTELFPSQFSFSLDVHSGFGMADRLWFPWARTQALFPRIDLVQRLHELLDRTWPHHIYMIEQQSQSYTTHGDLWDWLWLAHKASQADAAPPPPAPPEPDPDEAPAPVSTAPVERPFIPWTLELGSWTWVRKNPRQLLIGGGAFNPMIPHRYSRIMRRHMTLIEFMLRAVRNHRRWAR